MKYMLGSSAILTCALAQGKLRGSIFGGVGLRTLYLRVRVRLRASISFASFINVLKAGNVEVA